MTKTKLLGTKIQNSLKWDSNIVKRANSEFVAPKDDLKPIYVSYMKSLLDRELDILNLEDLKIRRERLCQKLAIKHKEWHFDVNNKLHNIKTRNEEK